MAKKLVVIGGVAAGPKAAAKARRCDPEMEIVIYQEEGEISYAGCGLPYYISGVIAKRDELISRTPGKFALDGIRVKPHHRVETIDLKKRMVSGRNLDNDQVFSDTFDRLVIATGAQPIRPRIEGLELHQVYTLRSIFDADRILESVRSEAIRNVVIVGGGYIGLEMAESLIHLGKNVTIVELAPQILTLFDEDLAGVLRQYLEKKGVRIFTSEGIKGIRGEAGKVTGVITSSREMEADAVLMSLGVRPQIELAKKSGLKIGETGAIWINEKMETSAEGVYAAGDGVEQLINDGEEDMDPLGFDSQQTGEGRGGQCLWRPCHLSWRVGHHCLQNF